MTESQSHKRAKSKAAGKTGKKEVVIKGKKRIDAVTKVKATEVERSGSMDGLIKAAGRLKASGKRQKVLQVPQMDMKKAADAMRKAGIGGTVKNISGTKRRSVALRKASRLKRAYRTKGTGPRKR